jgi:hypothetical protein
LAKIDVGFGLSHLQAIPSVYLVGRRDDMFVTCGERRQIRRSQGQGNRSDVVEANVSKAHSSVVTDENYWHVSDEKLSNGRLDDSKTHARGKELYPLKFVLDSEPEDGPALHQSTRTFHQNIESDLICFGSTRQNEWAVTMLKCRSHQEWLRAHLFPTLS